MTSSLCKQGGNFYVCSGQSALRLAGDQARFSPCNYQGVAIRMVLDTTKITSLNSALEDIRNQGEKKAALLRKEDAEITASKMSRMLLRDIKSNL